jgi:UDP-3-O-[3-hydroxymyristoyl] glucosamine N-acyltransferase
MKLISEQQISEIGGAFLTLKQSHSSVISQVLPPDLANSSSLVFLSTENHLHSALANKAQSLILLESLYSAFNAQLPTQASIWTTANIQQAMTKVLHLFDLNQEHNRQGIHTTASIHPTAQVHAKAHIGAYAVIGAHAKVGEDSVIFPHVYVGPYCEIGKRCYISAHTTIGSDGFGFFSDKNFNHFKIPQIGKVVIEDDCEFGSHCAIDRATLTETRIKQGSKFDNFCHIAHNVQFGENALVAAGFIVAGSTQIGKNLMTSGGVHALGHLNIADNVTLSARAGVTQDIEKSGMYGGFPLEPHRESIKTLVSIPQIKLLKKQVAKILNHLNLKAGE